MKPGSIKVLRVNMPARSHQARNCSSSLASFQIFWTESKIGSRLCPPAKRSRSTRSSDQACCRIGSLLNKPVAVFV